MEQFGEIRFQEAGKDYGEGIYDGRKFLVLAEQEDEQGNIAEGIVEGNFTDDERLYILTQWQLKVGV